MFFADITISSLGVGYEISYAENLGKEIQAIYEKEANVSEFLRNDEKIEFLVYESLYEVIDLINKIMNN